GGLPNARGSRRRPLQKRVWHHFRFRLRRLKNVPCFSIMLASRKRWPLPPPANNKNLRILRSCSAFDWHDMDSDFAHPPNMARKALSLATGLPDEDFGRSA